MKKTALITGAGGGIGLEFANVAALNGYNLLLIDMNEEALQVAKSSLETLYQVGIQTLNQDLSREEAAENIYNFTDSKGIEVEIIFNNAGFGNFGYFAQSSWAKDRAMLQVHVVTATDLIKRYLPEMIQRGKGFILNNASVAAFVPGPLMSTYHASKAYLLNFSQALANEVKSDGVNVAVLCPGMTKTNFAKANGNENPNIKFNIADAKSVAQFGFDGLMTGKVVLVPGIWNKLSAFLPRLLSRKRVATMVGNIQRKNHAKREDGKALIGAPLVREIEGR
ncbi:MAG TPA: SDR family oxidoreductase [Roseivirga sp.]